MNSEFIQALRELESGKGIELDVLLEAIEAALISAYKKNFGSLQNARVEIDRNSGEVRVFARKVVAEVPDDERAEISLAEARKINPNYEATDIIETEVTPRDFGRIAAQTAKQVVVQRIREAERNIIYEQFIGREDEIVTGVVQRTELKHVYVDLGKIEAVLPPLELVTGESYRHGDRIKCYVVEVKKTTKGPQVILSRTHPGLLKRLFELEVPEIHEGIVEIKAVSREPGTRSKLSVASKDERVDPVGACVGPRGMRVQAIVSELRGEKIDIVRWSSDLESYIANSLSPAKVVKAIIQADRKMARVIVPDYQLSLAIGKEGQNVRLAAKLTGWKIDIKSESQCEDNYLLDQLSTDEEEDAQPYLPYLEGE